MPTKAAGDVKDAEQKDAPKDGDEAAPAEGASKRAGSMPSYKLEKVGNELPEQEAGGRSRLYFDLLTKVTEDPGEWYQVAHFKTPTGATTALKAIQNKDREVPKGEWEFETRKVANPENPAGPRHSKLFARFMG